MLQLNRDTICDIPALDTKGKEVDTVEGQMALSHTYGTGKKDSCRNVVKLFYVAEE